MNSFFNYIVKYVLLFSIFLLGIERSSASHLVGGTMSYVCLGNDDYRITLTIYRDCNTVNGAPFDNQAPIGVFDGNGNLINTVLASFPGSTPVPIILNNPCLVSPPNVCIEKAEYQLVVNLPPIPGGYEVVYQRCCRNSNAVNIINPSSAGSTYKITIPDTSLATCNNSPVFNNPPPTTMCTGFEFTYDLSATDADGDSLVYSFGDPINGGSSLQPSPNPPSSPPYNNIPWNTGYSTNYQIDANPQFTIDSLTGFLIGTPTNAGFYTFSFTIKEYRNGVFLSEITRDFLLTIANCQINTVADFTPQGPNNFCDGLTVNFSNSSINSSFYNWDFGDPTTNSDSSTIQNPIYTYPDTGVYNIRLIANPGFFCADTIFRQFRIFPPINPSFNPLQAQCLPNNSFLFGALGNFDANAVFDWDFGPLATPQNSSIINPQVSFTDIGPHAVTLTIQDNGCTVSYTDTVDVYNVPIADFPPQSIFCDGLTVQFGNTSVNASGFFWDFGDPTTNTDSSILNTPSYTYSDSGVYNVALIANEQNTCFDTMIHSFRVYPPLQGTFSPQPDQCFFDNSFTLNAGGNFNSFALINWDFTSLGSPMTATGQQAQVSFLDTGNHVVTLSIQNYGCSSTYSDTLNVYPKPLATFTTPPDTGCQPFQVFFQENAVASTTLSYFWDFGDGNTSTLQNPLHTYLDFGLFDVSLTVSTDSGCIGTSTFFLNDLITVHPKPNSKFTINPAETFLLNNLVTAKDLSNVFYQEFAFGDGTITTDRSVQHSYLDTGRYLFRQLVITEFDCKDTSFREVWIKPDFLFFVPNAFTPDGDGINEIFLPKIQGILEYELSLYNRWGDLYFKTTDLSKGWNGNHKGKPALIDSYIWQIKVKTVDFLYYTRNGMVNLIR